MGKGNPPPDCHPTAQEMRPYIKAWVLRTTFSWKMDQKSPISIGGLKQLHKIVVYNQNPVIHTWGHL